MSMPQPLEKDIQRVILQWLALAGVFAFRVNSGGMRWQDARGKSRYMQFNGAEGCSDVVGVLPDGRALFVEVKRPGGKATEKQLGFLAAAQTAGAVAVVATGVEDLRGKLRAEGYAL